MTPSERIAFVRGKLSRDEFGAEIGVSGRTVQRWELEGDLPKGKELLNIANVFNINIHWLVTNEGEPYIYNKEVAGNVIAMDPAVHMLREVEMETGVALNTKQKEAVTKIIRKEIARRIAESKAEIQDLVESFKPEED